MSDTERDRLREALQAATRKYRRTEEAHEKARKEVIAAIVEALRSGLVRPAEVEDDSPFKGPYIRRIREDHKIPAFKKGQPAGPSTE